MPQLCDVFQSADIKKKDIPLTEKIKLLHYTKLRDNKKQYCDERDKEEIIGLANLIEADDGVLQPLLVRKVDTDEYEIIAGHKRRRAVRYLVEEQENSKFEFLPCIVKNISDVRAEFQLYSSNGFHQKTEYEIMHELENMKRLIEDYPEEFPGLASGRMVDKLAQQLHMKKTTVGEYLTISKNLGEKGMEAFKDGTLKKSAAVEMSSLSEAEQENLLDAGVTAHKDIKAYKEEKVEKTVHRTTVTDTVKITKSHTIQPDIKEDKPDAEVIDVLPGQIKVANTDMELVEEPEPVYQETSNGNSLEMLPNAGISSMIRDIQKKAIQMHDSEEYVKLSDVIDIINKYQI